MKDKKIIIGVSGSKGSFSEEAALYYCYMNKVENFELQYLICVDRVLRHLNAKKINIGIFPIENSNGGIVEEAVYAMSKYNFKIIKMFEIDIKHNLMVKPGTLASEIEKISSHQQALRQCRMYLRRKWGSIELEEYTDTAEAAKDLSSGKLSKTTAIIASKNCATLYELEILEEGIQDLKFNFTNFVVAEKR
ncbi:MAG: prephenate dehydratase [Candidatus Falkowbacteria bacterium]|nr:prephenate dehydratase [Candidatus Falkowbacteria bacterium]